MPSERQKQLSAVSTIIADYREKEKPRIASRNPELIDAWLTQFPKAMQEPILLTLAHVFSRTYVSEEMFRQFLAGLATNTKLCSGERPNDYWRKANLLRIQKGGSSQDEFLETFDDVLQSVHGFGIAESGSEDGDFIYLDDCIATGNRVRRDVCEWLATETPVKLKLHIITPIRYEGSYWVDAKIHEAAKSNGKTISITKWRLENFEMENRKNRRNEADVLWPSKLPTDPDVEVYGKYLASLGFAPELRSPGNPGRSRIFRNDEEKVLLEQAFLVRGCQIRREQSSLPDNLRPLGYHNLSCLGFGSMFVTYRNCPNNCPLPFWVEQKEFPALFPRKTNTNSADEKFLKEFLR